VITQQARIFWANFAYFFLPNFGKKLLNMAENRRKPGFLGKFSLFLPKIDEICPNSAENSWLADLYVTHCTKPGSWP